MAPSVSTSQTVSIVLQDAPSLPLMFGERGVCLLLLEEKMGVTTNFRGEHVKISGKNKEKVELAKHLILLLYEQARQHIPPPSSGDFLKLLEKEVEKKALDSSLPNTLTLKKGVSLYLKTRHQQEYLQSILNQTIHFGIGPAGTGKTYLAIAAALHSLFENRVRKIILSRPVVEAGENLGFLPGTLEDKISPYLRPLLDSMEQLIGKEESDRLLERKIVEIFPLAYMRGVSFKDVFVILDEAQNTSVVQMKMFLTRLDKGSKIVITGDPTQKDTPPKHISGLEIATRILPNIEGISATRFQDSDSVRHPLVLKILSAFTMHENSVENRL